MEEVKQTPRKQKWGEAGPGRPKGSQNKSTKEAKEIAQKIIGDPKYLAGLKKRIKEGSAPYMEQLLWHYRHGKPKETMDLDVTDRRKLVDFAQELALASRKPAQETTSSPAESNGHPESSNGTGGA